MTASVPYRIPRLSSLPFPLRTVIRRSRGMVGMVAGVGIALGIGMTLIAVSKASIDIFAGDYLKSGANLYMVAEGGTLIAVLPGDSPGTIKNGRRVLAQVQSLPYVTAAIGAMQWPMERERRRSSREEEAKELVLAVGVEGDPSRIPNAVDLKEGRWFRRSNEVVLGDKLAREKTLRIGDTIRLNGRDFSVVGIGKIRGFGYNANALAYIDYPAFRQRLPLGNVFNWIVAATTDPEAVRQRIPAIGSLSAFRPADLVRQVEEVNAAGMVIRWIINLLTLSIAALFVSNMLGRSVAERRLEFATMKAIGVPRRTILLTVAAEALAVTASAAVVGVVMSLGLAALLNSYLAPQYGFDSLYSADAGLFLLVLGLALALGLLAGLFPARQATRVDPVEILREA